MATKINRATNALIRSIGVITGNTLVIPIDALEEITTDRTRSNLDKIREQFMAVLSSVTLDSDGVGRIPLMAFVREVNPDAPFSLATATAQSTWAGMGIGSRLAYELADGRRVSYTQRPTPDRRGVEVVLEFHKRTPEQREKYAKDLAAFYAKQRKSEETTGEEVEETTASEATATAPKAEQPPLIPAPKAEQPPLIPAPSVVDTSEPAHATPNKQRKQRKRA